MERNDRNHDLNDQVGQPEQMPRRAAQRLYRAPQRTGVQQPPEGQQAPEPQQPPEPQQAPEPQQNAASHERPREQVSVESINQTLRAISEIERIIADARRIPFPKNLCVVEVSEITDLLGQLRIVLPKGLSQAQAVLANSRSIIEDAKRRADKTANDAEAIYNETVNKARALKDEIETEAETFDKETRRRAQQEADAIVADANTRAEQIIFAAQQRAQQLVDDNEIVRRANAYAMETRDRAEKDADSIYSQACAHVDTMLSGAASALSRSGCELAALRDSLLGPQNGNGGQM